MTEGTNRDSSRLWCGANLAFALLLLIAQSVGAAHYHQSDSRHNYTQSVQADDGLCSLCLFHFHAPGNSGTPFSDAAPAENVGRLTVPALVRKHAAPAILLFSRAPPTTAL
jgi:Protein of unknown function (DUF2946)